MLTPNHPDPERLSALASGDPDATADAALSEHVSGCVRCTGLVDELGALRIALAELPDLRPHRPLRLLPEVAEERSRVDRLGGWARRIFAPVLTAGAALAMVGLIGTTVPALDNLASGPTSATDQPEMAEPDQAFQDRGSAPAQPAAVDSGSEGAVETEASAPLASSPDGERLSADGNDDGDGASEAGRGEPMAERSPWPMVLFSGVALMIGAGLLRWILAPRAG